MTWRTPPRGSGTSADVDADVEAVGAVAAGDQLTASIDAGCQGGSLLGRGVEPCRDVTARDDEQVAWAHGEGVPEAPGEPVFEGDAVVVGKQNGQLVGAVIGLCSGALSFG
jgi:hypothetical protein